MACKHLAAWDDEATKEVFSTDSFAPLDLSSLRKLLNKRMESKTLLRLGPGGSPQGLYCKMYTGSLGPIVHICGVALDGECG